MILSILRMLWAFYAPYKQPLCSRHWGPCLPVSSALFRQERAEVRRERSSGLELRRLMVSCSSESDLCWNPSTESFPAAACYTHGGDQWNGAGDTLTTDHVLRHYTTTVTNYSLNIAVMVDGHVDYYSIKCMQLLSLYLKVFLKCKNVKAGNSCK